MRQQRGNGLPKWPAWCFLPMSGWYAIVSADAGVDRLPLRLIGDVAQLAAIGTWRYTQGIYRFDEAMFKALTSTRLSGDIPTEVLYRLPEWSLYVETPGLSYLGSAMAGFWAHLEWDANTERRELRLLINTDSALIPTALHLGAHTVTEAIDRMVREAQRQKTVHRVDVTFDGDNVVEPIASAVQPLLALVLYLCSEEPEIDDARQPGSHPHRPRPKKTKRGWRLFPAPRARVWDVGTETGERIRSATQSSRDHGSPEPHIRRAHWHGYWTGPRDGERKFIYKFLPPIFVGGDD